MGNLGLTFTEQKRWAIGSVMSICGFLPLPTVFTPMVTTLKCSLKPCYAKDGPWASSISIPWELVRNAESQAPPEEPTESEPAF